MTFKQYFLSFFTIASLLFSLVATAQKQRLYAQSQPSGVYIEHKVLPKESFSSIAALYNIQPDTLSEFNNIDYYEGELLAKSILVPLKSQNFYQRGLVDSTQPLIPVYYTTPINQTVQQISARFNKVPVAILNKWNGIPKEGIVRGMQILVGFLKANPDQLALFEEPVSIDIAMVEKPTPPKVLPATKVVSTAVAKVDKPKEKPVEKPVEKEKPVVVEKKETPKPVEEKPDTPPMVYVGYFKDVYKPTIPKEKVLTGDASIFESKSGWSDGKFYVLMKLKPGSIVKVTSANKTVFAKVLGELPEMKGNENIVLRLSNAAATELGVSGNTFPVVVTY